MLAAGAAGRLRVVANAAVGYDNIDVAAAAGLGIAVCNTPGVLDQTTADLAFLLILAASRLASGAEADLRAGRWAGWGISTTWGATSTGPILGLVGYGRIAPGGGPAGRGVRHGGPAPHPPRHRVPRLRGRPRRPALDRSTS